MAWLKAEFKFSFSKLLLSWIIVEMMFLTGKVRAVGKSNWDFLGGSKKLWYVNTFFFFYKRGDNSLISWTNDVLLHPLRFVGYLQTWRATLHCFMPSTYLYWSHVFTMPVLYFKWRLSLKCLACNGELIPQLGNSGVAEMNPGVIRSYERIVG